MHVGREIVLMVALFGCGLVLVVFGIVFTIIWPGIFDDIMAKQMQLTPNSSSYEAWKRPPINLSLDIYMFNWTNPEDFHNHSIKPQFVQLGPYRFTERPEKVDIKFNAVNSTVTYRRLSMFHFDAAGSNGSLADIITTVNVVALSTGEKARFADGIKAKSISIGLSVYQQRIHVTKPVGELLFEGYEDNMVSLAAQIPFLTGEEVPFDRVGWFYMRNNSAELTGWYNAHTGVHDIRQIGVLKNWNFKNTNGAFEGDCGLIHGSAGEFFPPKQRRSATISIFSPDMCRSIPLDYEKDVDVHGLLALKFSGGQRSIDNGSLYPENRCFAPGEGAYSGVLNISSCRFGVPVFMSYPHFFGADPYYIERIDGMHPDAEKHQFYMALEPSDQLSSPLSNSYHVENTQFEESAELSSSILLPHNRLTESLMSLYHKVPGLEAEVSAIKLFEDANSKISELDNKWLEERQASEAEMNRLQQLNLESSKFLEDANREIPELDSKLLEERKAKSEIDSRVGSSSRKHLRDSETVPRDKLNRKCKAHK